MRVFFFNVTFIIENGSRSPKQVRIGQSQQRPSQSCAAQNSVYTPKSETELTVRILDKRKKKKKKREKKIKTRKVQKKLF